MRLMNHLPLRLLRLLSRAAPPCRSDLFSLLGAERRPDHKWLIAGPAMSGSVFHVDPNATNAWNAAVVGRKKWILYPPGGAPPPGVRCSSDGADVTLPLSLGEWFLAFWRFHEAARRDRPERLRPVECVVEAGEMLFVPHGEACTRAIPSQYAPLQRTRARWHTHRTLRPRLHVDLVT